MSITKRVASIAAPVLLMAGLAQAAPSAPTRVELWFDPVNQWAENVAPLVERFNATHPHIHVEMVPRAANPNNFIAAVTGGAAPNVIVGAHSWSPTYAAQGLLVDLWPLIRRDGLEGQYRSDFFPGALVTGNTYKQQLIGLPIFLQIELMYYNPELFAAAGVSTPQPGWTWDDLPALLTKLRRTDSAGQITVHGATSNTAQNLAIYFIMQAGGTIWDEKTYTSTAGAPEFRDGLSFLIDLMQRGLIQAGQNAPLPGAEALNAFLTGRSAILWDGTYRLGAIEQSIPQARVLPLSRRSAKAEPITMLTLRNLNIVKSKDPAAEQASWEFVKWFVDTKNLGEASIAMSALAGRRSTLRDPAYAQYLRRSPHLAQFAELLTPYATGVGFTGIPGRDEVFNQAFTPLTVQLLKNELPLPAYIEQLSSKTNELLKPFR